MSKTTEAGAVLGNLVEALNMLETCREFSCLVPEVRVNLAYALSGAQTSQDVAAVDGRITVVRGFPHALGMPAWGASDHLARRILEVRRYAAEINAAINFKCNQQIIEVVQQYCFERSLLFGWLDRSQEPDDVTEYDGASMPWKVRQLFNKYKAMPRVFYEGPGWGKEPLFLALGRNAVEVATISIEVARRM
jgi:hydroxymethylpyrimidine/phosphomethylpyrimidine kinase